jgi:hypothetical protein
MGTRVWRSAPQRSSERSVTLLAARRQQEGDRAMRMHFIARALASDWPDLRHLGEEDIAAHAARFRGGVNNWVVQTFLRLRRSLALAGMTPTIGEGLVPGCVNISHRDCLNRVFAPYHESYVVGVRADRPPVHLCDREIVQNDLEPASPRTRFLPFWPQPGLIARDPSRGSRLERIAYFGRTSSAPAWFYDPSWHLALASLGVVFEIRDGCWFDYSQVDAVLAHRAEAPTMLRKSRRASSPMPGLQARLHCSPTNPRTPG